MPPAILHDSEDEDEDIVFDDDKDRSLSRSNGDHVAKIPDLDGTRDSTEQSTGSTERIQRQMEEVQRSLFADSGEQARSASGQPPAQSSSKTSPMPVGKRAKSTVDIAKPMSLDRLKARRLKSSGEQPPKDNDSATLEKQGFFARFAQDTNAQRTSDPVRFSDHSGTGISSGLPTGSLQTDFVNHEPLVMFRETGSTVAENSSAIDRMAEQARQSEAGKSSMIRLVESDDQHKSSSFPWPASEQAGSAKADRREVPRAAVAETGAGLKPEADADAEHSAAGTDGDAEQILTEDQESFARAAASSAPEASGANQQAEEQEDSRGKPRSSPVVQVNIAKDEVAKAAAEENITAHDPKMDQKTGRGRKRKIQDDASEPLNSDDIAVGLPKERYQPRPSKRRATQLTETPIDYSVVPERAARNKRSKTTANETQLPNEIPESGEARASPTIEIKTKTKRSKTRRVSGAEEPSTLPMGKHIQDFKAIGSHEPAKKSAEPSPSIQLPAAESPTAASPGQTSIRGSQSSAQSQQSDEIFKKPLPRSKPSAKSIRSKTTIFEDHVEFSGSQRSPSLSQQQAARASALQDVNNEAVSAKSRRNKKRVIDDDDDEDDENEEHGQDPSLMSEDEAPKKRGRGRPPKSASKTTTKTSEKSSAKVLDDSDDDDGAEEITVEKPKKRGRGRPPKSAEKKTEAADESKTTTAQASAGGTTGRSPTPPRAFVEPLSPIAKSDAHSEESAAAVSTKSPPPATPEKRATKPVKEGSTPQKPSRASPASHSPIKQSSAVPMRVGLSKRHRIPSLLKMVRPPAPKREDPRAVARAKKKREAEEALAREEGREVGDVES